MTFTAPTTGANARIAASTVMTDVFGHGTLAVHAGTVAGSYAVLARVADVAAPTTFTLTNKPAAPAALIPDPRHRRARSDGQTPRRRGVRR